MTDNLKEYPYPIGPLAESFPPLSPAQHAALVVRIAQHSFRPAVIVWREEIIFGVALLKAYKEAGVEPRFEQLADDADPTEALAAAAIPFLEMDNNARGWAAWMASEWSTRGRPRDEDQNSANLQNKTRAAMAERFGVSVRLINYFAQVLSENSKAVPTLQQAVREWKIKGTDAARVISRPAVVQERAVERVEREMAEAVEAAALADMLAQPLDETMTLHVAQIADILRLVPANTVDAIITPASIAGQLQMVEPGLGWSTIWEGSPQCIATFLDPARASMSSLGSMLGMARTGITKMLWWNISWTTSRMAMAASQVPGTGDSRRDRPRSVIRNHCPSMIRYFPPLTWIPKMPTPTIHTAKSSCGAVGRGLTS